MGDAKDGRMRGPVGDVKGCRAWLPLVVTSGAVVRVPMDQGPWVPQSGNPARRRSFTKRSRYPGSRIGSDRAT